MRVDRESPGPEAGAREGERLAERLRRVKLLVLDVDGVLTDGGMYYGENGEEFKKFNTRDGMGVELLRRAGIKSAIITGETTPIVTRRAQKLKIEDCYVGAQDKLSCLEELRQKHGLRYEEIAYIGDDVNDIPVMERVGLAVTVADGMDRVKLVAHFITAKRGGEGAVRELAELILEKLG